MVRKRHNLQARKCNYNFTLYVRILKALTEGVVLSHNTLGKNRVNGGTPMVVDIAHQSCTNGRWGHNRWGWRRESTGYATKKTVQHSPHTSPKLQIFKRHKRKNHLRRRQSGRKAWASLQVQKGVLMGLSSLPCLLLSSNLPTAHTQVPAHYLEPCQVQN